MSEPGEASQGFTLAQEIAAAAAAAAKPQRRPGVRAPVSEDAVLATAPTTAVRPSSRTSARGRDSCSRQAKPANALAPSAPSPAATAIRAPVLASDVPLIRDASDSTTASADEKMPYAIAVVTPLITAWSVVPRVSRFGWKVRPRAIPAPIRPVRAEWSMPRGAETDSGSPPR